MAKRKRTYTRYKTRVKRVYRRSQPSIKQLIDGGLAGLGGAIGSKWLGIYAQPVADLLVGWWKRNPTLSVIGGRAIGQMIASKIPMLGGGTKTSGGFFE